MTNLDRHGVAARLRALLMGQDQGDLALAAHRLGVSELALRISIDEVSPHPALEIIMAVVRHYGVDPTWLISGEYDAGTHRHALTGDRAAVTATIQRLAHGHPTPTSPLSLVRDDEVATA
jgi:hypothetical protein